MGALLTLEFRKFFRKKSFWICFAIMVIAIFGTAQSEKEMIPFYIEWGWAIENVQEEFLCGAVGNAGLIFLMGIFTSIFVCEDYEQDIIKNIYARGYSRLQVYFAKLISMYIITSAVFVFIELEAFLFSVNMLDGTVAELAPCFANVGVQYLSVIANVTMMVAICSWMRRVGSSLPTILLVPGVVAMVLSYVSYRLNLEKIDLSDYWVYSLIGRASSFSASPAVLVQTLAIAIVYIGAFVGLGAFFSKRINL